MMILFHKITSRGISFFGKTTNTVDERSSRCLIVNKYANLIFEVSVCFFFGFQINHMLIYFAFDSFYFFDWLSWLEAFCKLGRLKQCFRVFDGKQTRLTSYHTSDFGVSTCSLARLLVTPNKPFNRCAGRFTRSRNQQTNIIILVKNTNKMKTIR